MDFLELSEAEFDKFEKKQRVGNFFQGVKRARLRKLMGYDCFLLGVKKQNKVIAAALVLGRKGEAWLPLGPILDYENQELLEFFVTKALDFVKNKNFNCFEIFPPVLLSVRDVHGVKLKQDDQKKLFEMFKKLGFKHEGMTTKVVMRANRWMCVKDLKDFQTIEDVRKSYKKNVRNKLRKVGKLLELHVLEDKSELKEWIKAIEESDRKNGINSRKLKYFEQIWDVFGDEVQFMVVRKKENKELVSSRVVFYHPNETVTFVSGTIQENRRLNGMTVMQDWQLAECLRRGQKRINFYGLEGDFTKKNKLLEFKSGFGVEVEEYVGGFKYVIRPLAYYAQVLKDKLYRQLYNLLKR